MERITGVGGVFFRARDPDALARWYAEHLGIDNQLEGSDTIWWQERGPTVFTPFPPKRTTSAVPSRRGCSTSASATGRHRTCWMYRSRSNWVAYRLRPPWGPKTQNA
jgi:hypothetical protein